MKQERTRINERLFRRNERKFEIFQENFILCSKIEGINTRNKEKLKFTTSSNTTARRSPMGSLNIKIKKDTARNIDLENVRIAERIKQSKASLTRQSFDKDY